MMREFKSMARKYIRFTTIEVVYIFVVIVGVVMILCSSLIAAEPESNCSKVLSILGSLGTGTFPTGAVGFVLERMQNRNSEHEKSTKRLAILRLFNNSVHGYFNVICNAAIQAVPSLKDKKVFLITETLSSGNIQIENSDEELAALTILVARLKDSFSAVNPLYIATDVFTIQEINYFEMLVKDGEALLALMNKNADTSISSKRNQFISYLKTTCLAIPECSSFNEMITNGDNIFVPQ